ncbi:MAG: hypothetical protein AB8G15_14205 [Saprospiraceae bacterium]
MKTLKFVFFSLVILFNISCNKEEQELQTTDYIIFGFFARTIGGNHRTTFKLTDEKVFEDMNDNYLEPDPDFIELNSDKYEIAKDLIAFFPPQLLTSVETSFGCPNCGDLGLFFIEHSSNGVVKSWSIDTDKSKIPSYLHEFIAEMSKTMRLLKE